MSAAADSAQGRQGKPLAVRLIPSARRVTWDGPRRLMFTPPGSIALDNRPRRSTWKQSEPVDGSNSHADGTQVHLPQLTPLPADNPAPAQPAAQATPYAALDVSSPVADAQEAPALQPLSSSPARQHNTASSESSMLPATVAVSPARPKPGMADTPSSSLWAAGVAVEASARTPPQLSEALSRSRWQQQQSSSTLPQAAAASVPGQSSCQSSAAACSQTSTTFADCGGPPITRMRPPLVSTAVTASRKGTGKAQSSSGSAAAELLLNSVVCGWEEEGTDSVSSANAGVSDSNICAHALTIL